MILVYLGRWSYGRFKDDNNIFYKMKNDQTTGTWQDDIWCPIIIILLCTFDVPWNTTLPRPPPCAPKQGGAIWAHGDIWYTGCAAALIGGWGANTQGHAFNQEGRKEYLCPCIYVYLCSVCAMQKKSRKKREGNRRRRLKKTNPTCSYVYMHIHIRAKEITA
jgi:hypothetical protein